MTEQRVVPLLFSPPRLWIWPTLCTALAVIAGWSLLPHARALWQQAPTRVGQPVAAAPLRVWPGQRTLQAPLRDACPGGTLRAWLGTGSALAVQVDQAARALTITLPPVLPPGVQLLRVQGEACAAGADTLAGPSDSATPLWVLPPALPQPRLLVAQRDGALLAQVQGVPGVTAELRLLGARAEGEPRAPAPETARAAALEPPRSIALDRESRFGSAVVDRESRFGSAVVDRESRFGSAVVDPPQPEPRVEPEAAAGREEGLLLATLALPACGVASVALPLPLEQIPRLRVTLLAPPPEGPLGAAPRAALPTPSPPSAPPLLVSAAALAQEGAVGVLSAQLSAGARAWRFSWDVLIPDSYLQSAPREGGRGAPAPTGWQALARDGGPRIELALSPDAEGPAEPIDCLLRDAAVERVGAATRLRGGCPLRVSEALRTRLFHSGARFLLRTPRGAVALPPLPVALEVAAGEGAVIEDALPPLRLRGTAAMDPQPRTGEAGGYVRLGRRVLLPLVDVPEPTALLFYPVRRLAQHALRLIGLVLKLLPLMILLPIIWPAGQGAATTAGLTRRAAALPRGLPLLLILGAAAAPLTWSGWLGLNPGLPSDPLQIGAAVLWEGAALSWVFASVRSRGLLASALHTLVLLGLLVLPLLALQILWRSTGSPVFDRGAAVSLLLSGALVALVVTGCWHLGEAAGLLRWQQAGLTLLTSGLCLSGGLSPPNFYVDAVAQHLAGLAPLLVVLSAIAALRPLGNGASPPASGEERLLWPLFLAAVPPLVMDHGLPLGILCGLLVFRVWAPRLRPPFQPPTATPAQGAAEAASEDPVPDEAEAVLVALEEHPLLLLSRDREALQAAARRGGLSPESYRLGLQALTEREVDLAEQGYTRRYRQLPDVLSLGTAEGPLRDGWRGLRVAVPPMMLYLLFVLLVAEPFDPQRLLRQLGDSLRLLVQLLSLGFFFGFAFSALPGRNGLLKALYATLLTMACELPAGLMTWYRGEDVVRGLVRWVGVLGILGWVGLWGFDLHRLRLVQRGLFDLSRVRGYSRGFALTTSLILGIFTTVVSGLTGKLGALLQSAVTSPPTISAPRDPGGPAPASDAR